MLLVILAMAGSAISANAARPFHAVIDPGHGGTDHGAKVVASANQFINERDVTLQLAQELAKELKAMGIQSTLTRNQDADIALPDRTAMANRLKADLFLSIHMNSSPSPSSVRRGIETYILNNSTNESSIRLANLENKVLKGSVADNQPQTPVALIVKDLILDGNLKESKHAACLVQSELAKSIPGTVDRGVRQALFYVLLGADMPSVLVEAGFLDNVKDRAQVTTEAGRHRIAASIANAIRLYRGQKGTRLARKVMTTCRIH